MDRCGREGRRVMSVVRGDVAALYVDPRGPYPALVLECYDALRDARTYSGPLPIVAHPPCGPWGTMRHMSSGRGEAQDVTCGPFAVDAVRRWGGVLEHPRGSSLFGHCGLPRPGELPDACGGITFEVCQVDWGHVARKRTWLYMVGIALVDIPPKPPSREPTHWASGWKGRSKGKQGSVVPAEIKVCSAQQRRRTPAAFAAWLVELASRASSRNRRQAG